MSVGMRVAVMGAAAGLAVGVSPTAQAAEKWGGIATGPDGHWALWFNSNSRGEALYFGNWARCGADCKRVLVFEQCGALAFNGGAWTAAEAGTTEEAEGIALGDLPGSWIVASRCNDGGGKGTLSWQG